MTQFELLRQTSILATETLAIRLGRSFKAAIAGWWKERRSVTELRGLDDHILRDMGVSRSEIRAAVRGELYRR